MRVPALPGRRLLHDPGPEQHQCVYYSAAQKDHITTVIAGFNDHFTTFVPARGGGRYNTGTKVSGTADTAPTCGGGNGNCTLIPLLSGTLTLSRT
ncbi:hypothetical protein ACGFNX_22545 [Streptomyces sp. NPDC048723]|uniref:hypothetical protein n=1 Tax=unclassified Streptomyces TaxID=2593676 RepID=UPI0035694488